MLDTQSVDNILEKTSQPKNNSEYDLIWKQANLARKIKPNSNNMVSNHSLKINENKSSSSLKRPNIALRRMKEQKTNSNTDNINNNNSNNNNNNINKGNNGNTNNNDDNMNKSSGSNTNNNDTNMNKSSSNNTNNNDNNINNTNKGVNDNELSSMSSSSNNDLIEQIQVFWRVTFPKNEGYHLVLRKGGIGNLSNKVINKYREKLWKKRMKERKKNE